MHPPPYTVMEKILQLSISLDVYFYERVSPDQLAGLPGSLDFPVMVSAWRVVEYCNGAMFFFVTITTGPETVTEVVDSLWKNLGIPFIAYESGQANYHQCVRWSADAEGIRNTTIQAG